MRFPFLVLVAVTVLLVPARAAAQFTWPPSISFVSPVDDATRHALNPKIRVEYDTGQCIDDGSGDCDPLPGTVVVKLNWGGNLAQSKFGVNPGWTVADWYAENGSGNAGVNNFQTGWNTLYAKVCNGHSLCDEDTISVYIDPDPQEDVITGELHPSYFNPGRCEGVPVAPGARFACDALVVTHGIPGYTSLDTRRSVSLVYSTRAAQPDLTVPVNVELVWDAAASTIESWLSSASIPATAHTYWDGAGWDGTSGSVERRIALSLPAEGNLDYVGRHAYTAAIEVTTNAGVYGDNAADTVPYYFLWDPVTTPIARGWGIAGISRLYLESGPAPGSGYPVASNPDLLLASPAGGVQFYEYLSTSGHTSQYGRPPGAFATLERQTEPGVAHRFVVTHMDGTRHWYRWINALGFARLDSIVRNGRATMITYRSQSGTATGWPKYVIDPQGDSIDFQYASGSVAFGRLVKICAPRGSGRCTEFTYGSSGGNTVLTGIEDPDGGTTTFGYSGGPHWSFVTTITPRGHGEYAIGYHADMDRPSKVTRPNGAVVEYLAPQLAGAPVTGGTSGNPAAAAPADSSWGWVEQPLDQRHWFAADRYGGVTFSRGPDGQLFRTGRNPAGQPVWIWSGTQAYGGWTYNAVGAVIADYPESGDTNVTTYAGACGSGTGYPCLPTQRVRSRAPYAPDTTKWYYGSDEVVDSIYRSSAGFTRYTRDGWHRVTTVTDPDGHETGYAYGDWGNLSTVVRDSSKVCEIYAGCSWAKDTTGYTYDAVTGWLESTQRGDTGRQVMHSYDRIGRDTMVTRVTSGGSADTTKTRYNDAAGTVTVIDGRGNSIVFLHDNLGQRIRRTDAAGKRDTFAYDLNGRLVSWKNRRNQTITYEYDDQGRLVEKTVPGVSGTSTYGYHGTHGTLDTIVTPHAAIYRVRDPRGRMIEERTVVNGVTRVLEYEHNEAGGVTELTDPWGGTYTYGWNGATRTRTVSNPFSETYSMRYSADGLLQAVVFPTGKDSLEYDPDHGMTAAGLNAEITYGRDPDTKGINRITWGSVTQTFGYDGFHRLASESTSTSGYGPQSETFAYDVAGNRTGSPTGYSYLATNAARKRPNISGDAFAPGDSITYDNEGNPRRWKNLSTGEVDSLWWDPEGRLMAVRRRDGTGEIDFVVHYRYDGLGRRVHQYGTNPKLWVWDGWTLLAETDGNGNATRRYTHHPDRIDFPLAMREGSTTHYFHRDGQGNIYKVRNTSGSWRSHYRYRAWGDRYNVSTENVASPFTYKGAQEDRETGLIYMRYRYYSPRLERFVNEDPIGLLGGMNLYGFASGDPVNSRDPLGLCVFPATPVCVVGTAIVAGLISVGIDFVAAKLLGGNTSGVQSFFSFALGAVTGGIGGSLQFIANTPARFGTAGATTRLVANTYGPGRSAAVTAPFIIYYARTGNHASATWTPGSIAADATATMVTYDPLMRGSGGFGHLWDYCRTTSETTTITLPDGTSQTVTRETDCWGNIKIKQKVESGDS